MTVTAVIEAGLAGWALGAGWLGLLVAIAAVTAADTAWGMTRRGVIADLAGLELAVALTVLLIASADITLAAIHRPRLRRLAGATRPPAALPALAGIHASVKPADAPQATGVAARSSAAARRTDCCQSPRRSRQA